MDKETLVALFGGLDSRGEAVDKSSFGPILGCVAFLCEAGVEHLSQKGLSSDLDTVPPNLHNNTAINGLI